MPEGKIVGYKKVFGFVMPDWVSEKTVKNVIAGMLVVTAMLLILIFVIWPNLDTVRSREAEIEGSKASLDVLRKSKMGLDRLTADLTGSDQEKVLAAIPEDYSPELAIYSLRRISAETGVSILTYTLPSGVLFGSDGSVDTKAGEMVSFASFPVRITVSAQVDSLLRFIDLLEDSLPYGTVSDLNIQEVTKLARSADKTVQMVLEINYYQAKMGSININKIQPFTGADLELVASIRQKNLVGTRDLLVGQTALPTSTGSGSVFGF